MKTDKYGVFSTVSLVVDTTTGERVSQYFTRLGDAKRKAKHFNAGLGYQRYEAHEMHVSPKVSTFAVIDRAMPDWRLVEVSCYIGALELTIQNTITNQVITLKK